MTIRLLLRSVKLKCNHGGVVKIGTDQDRHVADEQSQIVTDHDLYDRSPIACPQGCKKVTDIPEGKAKNLLTRNGEIPLLRKLRAITNAGGEVKLTDTDIPAGRQELGEFLRRPGVEGSHGEYIEKAHGKILRHKDGTPIVDPETYKGFTKPVWKDLAPKVFPDATADDLAKRFNANMTDDDWNAVFDKGYWNPLASSGGSAVENPAVLGMMVDWKFNGGFNVKQIQQMLKDDFGQDLTVDGAYGPKTIDALNNVQDQDELFDKLFDMRDAYFKKIGGMGGWGPRLRMLARLLKNVRGVPQ